jgi:hypothetical protein
MTRLIDLDLMTELITLAKSFGFLEAGPDLMTRDDGAAILWGQAGDFAYRRADGTTGTCNTQKFWSYRCRLPIQFASARLIHEFSKR